MNSKLNIPARITVFIALTLLVIAAALTLPNLSSGPVLAQVSSPAAPVWPTASPFGVLAVGTQTVELNWTASTTTSPPVTGHKIERSTDNGEKWVVVNADTGNEDVYYTDTHSSLAGKTVIYRVAAINLFGTGLYSANSAEVPLPTAGQQPGAPTGLKAMVTPDEVDQLTLSWTGPASSGASVISGFTVQWSEKGEHPWTSLTAVTAITATHDAGAGVTRHYRVAATNTQGTGPYSAIVSGTTPPAGVPEAPTWPSVPLLAVGTQTVELNWTASTTTSPPVTGHKIERSTDNGTTWVVAKANTGNKDVYYTDTHSSLGGKTVFYRVAAMNSLGTGAVSANSTGVPLPTAGQQPGAPTRLTAMVTGGSEDVVNLSWTSPASEGASTITEFTVQWSEKGEHPWTSLAQVTTTTATHDAGAGVTRHYRVAATNTQGTGPYSAIVSGTTPPAGVPEAPTWPSVPLLAVGTQTVELNWAAPTGTISGYKIERSTDNGTTWVVAKTNTGNDELHYTDTHSSLAGKTVIYRVAAMNSLGTGPYSANSTGVPLPTAGQQPGAPTGLKVTVTPDEVDQITLSWTAPTLGASVITGFTVQWSEKGEHPWTSLAQVTTTTATHDAGVGVTRHYRVAATNTQGTGPYSAIVSGTTPPAGVPAVAPTWPTDQPLGVLAVGTQTVELEWIAPTGTISGYKIERSTDDGTTWAVVTDNTGNDELHYTDTHSSLAGKTVTYRVAAINSLGTGPVSENSAGVPLPTAGQQPGAPTGLTATEDGLIVVILFWTKPASEGRTTITGYTVQYSSDGKQPWMPTVPTHSGTETTYRHVPGAGVTHHYRVAATNAQGTGPYSASVTPGPPDQEGEVTLSTQEPMAGTAITATLMDADGTISNRVWKWQRSMDKASWMDITGATASSYTPVAMDVDYYLRAMITYTDKNRSDRMAYSMATDSAVALPSDRMGTVRLSTQEPLVGEAITATVTDADSGVTGQTWQWQKSMTTDGTFMDISDATSMSYTPTADDVSYYLRVTVTYTDKYRSGRTAESMATSSMVVANNAPEFAADTATRMIEENSAAGTAVGDPVMATDADADDTLTYALSGNDTMYFTIDDSTGQIMVGMDTMLDYEAEKMTYMVTVTATDDSEAPNSSASIAVAINVTNVNEAPYFAEETATLEVAENTAADTAIGDAFGEAMDPDEGDMITYSLGGDDMDSFGFDAETRQIMTMAALVYETKSSYSVMVIATDSGELTDSIDVTINVTDVDEGPVQRYDDDKDGVIIVSEVLMAIQDHFAGKATVQDVLQVIAAHFATSTS